MPFTVYNATGTSLPLITRRKFFSLPDISKLAKIGESVAKDAAEGINAAVSAAAGSASGGQQMETGRTGAVESDGEGQRYHARKILPYSPEQLYQLVADVPSYSSFIPFCNSSVVLRDIPPSATASPAMESSARSSSSSGGASTSHIARSNSPHGPRDKRAIDRSWKPPASGSFDVDAELRVGFGGFEESYVSRVEGRPFESVTAQAKDGGPLFKALKTTWSFSPASGLSPHPTAAPASAPFHSGMRRPNDTSPRSDDATLGPTLLTIDLAFTFNNPLHRIASQAVLPKVADRMVEAFERRCLDVWGPGKA